MLEKIATTVGAINALTLAMSSLSIDEQIEAIFEYATALIEFHLLVESCNFSEDEIRQAITKENPNLDPDVQIMVSGLWLEKGEYG